MFTVYHIDGTMLSTLHELMHLIFTKNRRSRYSYYPHFSDKDLRID